MSSSCVSRTGDNPGLSFRVRFAPDALPVSLRAVVVCNKETLSVMQEVRTRTSGGSAGKRNTSSSQRPHCLLGVCSVPMIQFYRQDHRVCITRGCTYVFDNASHQSSIAQCRGISSEKSNPSNWTSLLFQMEDARAADALVELLLQGFAEEIFIPPPMPDNITEVMRSRSNSRMWRESKSWRDDDEESRMEPSRGEISRDAVHRKASFPLPNPPLPPDAEEEWIQPVHRHDMHRSSPPIRKTRPTHGVASSTTPPLPFSGPAHPSRSPRQRTPKSNGKHEREKMYEGHLSGRRLPHRTSPSASTVLVEVTTMTTPRGSHHRHTPPHYSPHSASVQSPQPRAPDPHASNAIPPALSSAPRKRKQKTHPKPALPPSSVHKTPEALSPHAHRQDDRHTSLSSSPLRRSRKKRSSRRASKPASPSAAVHRSSSVQDEVRDLFQRFMRFEHHRQHMLVQLHRELVRKAFQTAVHTLEQMRMQQVLSAARAASVERKEEEKRQLSLSAHRSRREAEQEAKAREAREARAASTERKLQEAHRLYGEVQKERDAVEQERAELERARKRLADRSFSIQQEEQAKERKKKSRHARSPEHGISGAVPLGPLVETGGSDGSEAYPLSPLSSHRLPPMKVLLFRRLLVGEHWKRAFFPACEEDVRHSALVDIALAAKLPRALVELQRVEPVGHNIPRGTSMEAARSRRRMSESGHGGGEGRHYREKSTSWSMSEHLSGSRRSLSRHVHRHSSHGGGGSGERTPSRERRGVEALHSSFHPRDGFYNEVREVEDRMDEETIEDVYKREGEGNGVRGLLITSKIRFVPSEVLTTDALRHRLRMCGFPILRNMYAHRAAFGMFQGLDEDMRGGHRQRSRSRGGDGWDASFHRKTPLSRRSSPGRGGGHRSRDYLPASPSLSPRSSHHHALGHERLSLSTSGMLPRYGDGSGGGGGGRPTPKRSDASSLAPGGPGGPYSAAAATAFSSSSSPSARHLATSYGAPTPPPATNPYAMGQNATALGLREKSVPWSYAPVTTAGGVAHGREMVPSLQGMRSTETVDRAVMEVAEVRQRNIIMTVHRHRLALLELEEQEQTARLRLWMEQEPMERCSIQVQAMPLKRFPYAVRSILLGESVHRDQVKSAEGQARQWLERQRNPFLAKGVAKAKEALRKEEAAGRLQLELESLSKMLDIITYDQRQRRWWGNRVMQTSSRTHGMVYSMLSELIEVEREERLDLVRHETRLRSVLQQHLYEEEEAVYAQRLQMATTTTDLAGIGGRVSNPGTESGVDHRAPSSQGKFSDIFGRESHSNPSLEVTTHSVRRRRFQSQKHVKPFHYLTFSPDDMDFKPNAESATDGILGCTINRNLEVVEISRPLLRKDGDEDGMEFQTGDMILDASGQALHSLSHFREVLSHRIMLIQEEAKMEFPDLPEEEWTTNPALQKYIEVLCEHHNFLIQVLRGCDIVQLIVKS